MDDLVPASMVDVHSPVYSIPLVVVVVKNVMFVRLM
jgi:hypothetical protein